MRNSLFSILLILAMTALSACDGKFSVEQRSGLPTNIDDGLGDTDHLASENCVTIQFSWDAPTTREDGQALPSSELGSYTLYVGLKSGEYDQQHTVMADKADLILSGFGTNRKHYFAITATDKNGLESKYSKEIVIQSNKCSSFLITNKSTSIDPVAECNYMFTKSNILPADQAAALCRDITGEQLKCAQEALGKSPSIDALFEACTMSVSL